MLVTLLYITDNKAWLLVTRYQCGISALGPQASFRGETGGSVPKCRLVVPQAGFANTPNLAYFTPKLFR